MEDAKRLCALWPAQRLNQNARACVSGLMAAGAHARHMQQNRARSIVRRDETIALGRIEPVDSAGHLHDLLIAGPRGQAGDLVCIRPAVGQVRVALCDGLGFIRFGFGRNQKSPKALHHALRIVPRHDLGCGQTGSFRILL